MCNTKNDAFSMIHDFVRNLFSDSDTKSKILKKFENLNCRYEQVNYAYDILNENNLLPVCYKIEKNNALSSKFRNEGNEYFKRKDYENALKLYTKSAFYAEEENGDNLSLAYANRSAVLFERGYFKECLIDIENAQSNNYPIHLNEKLVNRRNKAELLQIKQLKLDYHQELPKIQSDNQNKLIECASDSVTIKYNSEYGRHVIANRKMNIGEIIAVERPFTSILLKEHAFTHCYHCLKVSYNLIPCKSCVRIGYCSKECSDKSLNNYHKYECNIIDYLYDNNVHKLVLVALKIVIIIKDTRDYEFNDNFENKLYKSENYEEIYNLITNHENRNLTELLKRSMMIAMVYHLIKFNTNFFNNNNQKDEIIFMKLLLKYSEAASSNFHEISELIGSINKTYEMIEIGAGAYSFLSLLNHSCSPNVIRHCYGQSIVLRALKPIEKDEQLLDNYGYHHALMKKSERLEHLKSQYLFDCCCIACVNDWPLYEPNETRDFEMDEEITEKLLKGDLKTAIDEIPRLLKKAEELHQIKPTQSILEIQEYVKHCYAILANKRCLL